MTIFEFLKIMLVWMLCYLMKFPTAAAAQEIQTISVSSLKVTWDAESDRDYYVSCAALDPDYAYTDNMYFTFQSNALCYITGLRENTEYTITVEPILFESEADNVP